MDWRLVGWLCIGSVPCAFAGVLVARAIGGDNLQAVVKTALGVALMLAVIGLVTRAYMQMREHAAPPCIGCAGGSGIRRDHYPGTRKAAPHARCSVPWAAWWSA